MSWFFYIVLLLLLGLVFSIKIRYFSHQDCLLTDRLDDKIVIVTGCNSGIGLETVGELACRGAKVIMACRDMEKCQAARKTLLIKYGEKNFNLNVSVDYKYPIQPNQLICEQLDLSSVKSIEDFAYRINTNVKIIHILINNAGISLNKSHITDDGIEEHIKVNYLGHFLLTNLLRSSLKLSGCGRVINLTSLLHKFVELDSTNMLSPIYGSSYALSKLYNVMHAIELSTRWESDGIIAVSVHPGLVRTSIFRSFKLNHFLVFTLFRWLSKSPYEGAQTVIYCALEKRLIPGGFYFECQSRTCNRQALDKKLCSKIWDDTELLIKTWKDYQLNNKRKIE